MLKEPYHEITKGAIQRWEEISKYFNNKNIPLPQASDALQIEEQQFPNEGAKENIKEEIKAQYKEEVKNSENEEVNYYKPSFGLKKSKKSSAGQEDEGIEDQASAELLVENPKHQSVEDPNNELKKAFNFHKMNQASPKLNEAVTIKGSKFKIPANEVQMKNDVLNIKSAEEMQKPEEKGPILNREENNQGLEEFLSPDSVISSPDVKKEADHNEFDGIEEILIG